MTVTHKALVPLDGPPRPACGGSGRSVARAADVTCPDCLSLDTERLARVAESDEFAAADEADAIEASRAEENRADAVAQAEAGLHDLGDDELSASRPVEPVQADECCGCGTTDVELFADPRPRHPREDQAWFCRDCAEGKFGVPAEEPAKLHDAHAIPAGDEPLLTASEVLDSLADETSVHYLTGLECRTALGLAQETAPEALAAAIAQVLAQRTTP